jgi:hypothetical protein
MFQAFHRVFLHAVLLDSKQQSVYLICSWLVWLSNFDIMLCRKDPMHLLFVAECRNKSIILSLTIVILLFVKFPVDLYPSYHHWVCFTLISFSHLFQLTISWHGYAFAT